MMAKVIFNALGDSVAISWEILERGIETSLVEVFVIGRLINSLQVQRTIAGSNYTS